MRQLLLLFPLLLPLVLLKVSPGAKTLHELGGRKPGDPGVESPLQLMFLVMTAEKENLEGQPRDAAES